MNETFEQAQLTHILYEISMSIGTSVELRPMLKPTLSTILKKLNCVAGGVYQQVPRRDGSYKFQAAYTIPRSPERNSTYQEAFALLPHACTTTEANTFLAELPIIGQSKNGNFYHILELPDFGLLILVKNQKALTEPVIKSLSQLLAKLATAAIACVNEAKLRQSEERYRMFTNATFDGIMVHDGAIVTEINPALAALISYKPEDLVGKNILDFLDPSCHELATANALHLTEAPYELLAVRKDGTRLPVQVTDREYTENGHTYRITAVRDLSHQKQLETELQSLVERRTRQVEISTQVAQAIASATNLDDLYQRIVTEIKEQFGYYHTQLLRYNAATNTVQLIAGYGKIGEQMHADGHQLPMGKGLIGTAAATGQSLLRPDLADDPDWTPNPLLPETKSEIAVPIKLGEEILGVLDVQSNITGGITNNDQLLLEGLCGQIAVAIDTTRLNSNLQETSTFLDSIIENIPDMVFVKDAKTLNFVRVNKASLHYFDLSLEDILGKDDHALFKKEQADFFIAKDKEVLTSRELVDIPIKPIELASGPRILHITKVPIIGADGTPKYLLSIFDDITFRKATEEELIKFKLSMERSTDAIFMTDTDGVITFINDAFVKHYGFSQEEAIGKNPRILKSGQVPRTQYEVLWQSLLAGKPVASKVINKTKDGRLLNIETNNNPILDESGQVIGFLAIHRDVTKRTQTEEALRQSEQKMQEVLDQQKALLMVSQNLTSINDPDEFYKQVIIQAQEHLGFERLGLYLLDIESGTMNGTYGIDPTGKLRSEQDNAYSIKDEPWMDDFIYNTEHIVIKEDENLYEQDEVIGRGWLMVAAIWQEDKPMGLLFADNLLSQAPLRPSQPDTLTAYATTIAQLIDRIQANQALLESEQTVQTFVKKQQELHEIGLQLSTLETLDELYHEAIQLGHTVLGFDRLGLYLVDAERTQLQGSYGIGLDGKLRNEHHEVHIIEEQTWTHKFLYHNERLVINEEAILHEDGEVVGHGWNLTATLWSKGKPIGLLFADNLINQQPLQPHQPELLTAFSATIANLIERQQATTEREHLLQNTEQQAKNIALLNDMSTLLNQAKNVDEIYRIAGEYTQKITNDERTSLALLTDNNQMLELFALSGLKGAVPLGTKLPVQGTGIGFAIQEKRQAYFPEDADMQTYIDTQKMAAAGLQSAIVTPLFIEGAAIGCLNTASKTMPESVSQKKRLLQQIGSLVSSALQVKQAQERSGTILESITVPMVISRVSDGMIFYANEHLADMVRLPLDNLVGNQTPNFYVTSNDRETVINKIRTEGGLQNYELELQRADQSRLWALLTAKLIQFEGDAAVITSLIDISDRIETQAATEQQAADLQTVAELSTRITSIQDPQELMEVIVQETQKRFGLYHCHIFLVDESGKNLNIQACGWHEDAPEYGTHGDAMIALNASQSLVAQAARTKQAVIINDVRSNPNWLPNKLLPDTRSEVAVPMVVGETVVGVFDVQSTQVNRFSDVDVQIQSTLASQIAVALENARSLVKTQQAVAELDALTRRLTRESWEEYLSDTAVKETGFVYNLGQLSALEETGDKEVVAETAVSPTNSHLTQSLLVHGEAIGRLTVFNKAETETLDADTALIIAAVAEQLSARVENIRLTEQTQQALAQTQTQAQRLGLLNEISAEMSNVDSLNKVFEIIFDRIPSLLQVDRVSLAMLLPDGETLEILAREGEVTELPTGTKFPLAGSPTAQALQENRVIVSNEPSPDNIINSAMVAPLFSAGRAIGTLNIGSKRINALTIREETLLQQLATMLSSVIDNKQLLAAAQARAERERQVRTITDKIRRGTDREAILKIAQKEISSLIGAKQSAAQLGTKTQLLDRIQQTIAQTQEDSL